MGQCYTVFLKLKYDDEQAVIKKAKEYYRKHDGYDINFGLESYNKDHKLKTIDDIVAIVLTPNFIKWDKGDYESDFDASYTWEEVLENWFKEMAPVLDDKSSIEVYPDEGSWKMTKHKGEIEEVWRM